MAGERIESTNFKRPVDALAHRGVTTLGPGVTTAGTQTRPGSGIASTVIAVNYLRWTEDFTNALWVKMASLTASTSTIPSPDPGRTAQKITTTLATRTMYQDTVGAFLTPETVWISAYIRAPVASVVRLTSTIGAITAFQDLDVGDYWQAFSFSTTAPALPTICRFTFTFNTIGTYYVFGPQVTKGDKRFPMYLPSTATNGTYAKLTTVERFIMADTNTGSLMNDVPVAATHLMMDSV